MRHYIKIILVSLNFLRPKLEGVATQIWVATHYLRTPGLEHERSAIKLFFSTSFELLNP